MAMAKRQSAVVVRGAQLSDVIEIAALSEALGYSSSQREIRERLRTLLANPLNQIFVAETAAAGVVGWVHVYRVDLIEMAPFAEIGGLIVDEAFRCWGIGSQLIEAAQRWTRDGGMSDLRVRSRVERERAHRFYYRHGFTLRKTQLVLTKCVDEGRGDIVDHPRRREASRAFV